MTGWQRYKIHPDPRLRARYAWEVAPLRTTYAGAVWAMKQYYRDTPPMFQKMQGLLSDIYREFGWKTRIVAPLIGLFAYLQLLKEEQRLTKGWHYEPTTFYEKNPAARAIQSQNKPFRHILPGGVATPLSQPEPALKP